MFLRKLTVIMIPLCMLLALCLLMPLLFSLDWYFGGLFIGCLLGVLLSLLLPLAGATRLREPFAWLLWVPAAVILLILLYQYLASVGTGQDLPVLRLPDFKIAVPCEGRHRKVILHGAAPVLFHHRAAQAAALARAHLYKAVVDPSALDILQGRDAVFHTVHCQVGIIRCVAVHGLQDAAGCRKEPCPAVGFRGDILPQADLLRPQPAGQFLKGQHGVHDSLVVFRLILLGQAGSDEHRLRVGNPLFDVLAVGLHGRNHVRQVLQLPREELLDQ